MTNASITRKLFWLERPQKHYADCCFSRKMKKFCIWNDKICWQIFAGYKNRKRHLSNPKRLLKCRFLYFVKIAFLVAYQVLSSASLCIWYVLQEVRYGAVQRFTYKIQLLKAHTLRKLIIEMADRCGPYTSLFGQPCLRPTPVSEDTRQMIFDHRIAPYAQV